jgi:uncharacterized membrane protein
MPCCQPLAVTNALVLTPFGMTTPVFWIYVSASLVSLVGLIKVVRELPHRHGVDKIMPFGRLMFAIPLAVFASEHFTLTTSIANLVPRWMPAHMFWAYFVGVAFACAALSMVVLVQERSAAALVGVTMFLFVLVMDLPALAANPHNRFLWALALRQLAFSGGAFAFAMAPSSARNGWSSPARFFVGVPAMFYGVQHLLHPEYVPGIPLQRLTAEWIPGRIPLSYVVGVVLMLAGICLLTNKSTRMAATALGLAILLTMFWIYLPMLLAAPRDLVALNFFFDTLMFCGAVLLLADAMPTKAAVTRARR